MQHEDEAPEFGAGRALEALRWFWEAAYEVFIEETTGLWCARRLDGLGTIEGSGPDGLRMEILDDWTLRPLAPR
jgi:hypothetical protein